MADPSLESLDPATAPKRTYRLRDPQPSSEETRVKVGLYLLPSLYQRVKQAAVKDNRQIYAYVEEALEEALSEEDTRD